MTRFSKLALTLVCGLGLWSGQALAQAEFYDQYGIYPLTPKGPAYGLGAVMIGFFDSSGKQLRVRTEGGEGLICNAKVEIKPDEIKNCAAEQSSITNTQQRDATLDLTLGIKKLLDITGNAKYVRKVTLKVTGGCLFQLSTVQAQKLLDSDPDCLRAARTERARLSNLPLKDKLAQPGAYLLMWETTRVFHANVNYVVDFTAGAGIGVKTEAEKAIKDVAGSISAKVSTADKLELTGSGLWIGLAPRYYEQWYQTPDMEKIVAASVEKLVKSRGVVGQQRALAPKAPPKEVDAVEKAGIETDKKLDAALAKAAPK
jgi:hypothetical protein